MKPVNPRASVGRSGARQFGLMALGLLALLGLLFWKGLLPGYTLFSNDGPLGTISAQCCHLPEGFSGFWQDLNWLGGKGTAASPDVTQLLALTCSKLVAFWNWLGGAGVPPLPDKLLFSKVFAPFAAFFVGLSAWLCFRRWHFSPLACALGGLAAGLNSDFLSTACWGVAAQPIAFGLDFLALGALADQRSPRRWLWTALGGVAVGMTIMEGYDIAAIFSVFVAAFILAQALAEGGPRVQPLLAGLGRLALVVVCSGFVAIAALYTLVGSQIIGIAGMGQDAASKAQRWAEATQWSLPKQETLAIAIPGLFGFRMNTPADMAAGGEYFQDGGYWGLVGSDAAWDQWLAHGRQGPAPQALARFNGGGIYAGVLVVLVAAWAAWQCGRRKDSVFSASQRNLILFWLGVAGVALLLAYGRFAPFYQFLYALPYASTARNPAKFIHVTEWALLIVFAYGVDGLSRRYLAGAEPAELGWWRQCRVGWAKAEGWDRRWLIGSGAALAASLLGWLAYGQAQASVAQYIQAVGFDPPSAKAMAAFSARQVGWAVLFLALGWAALSLALTGGFRGRRARHGGLLLGTLLVADLLAADLPYIVVWDYPQKYASNPIVDQLREPRAHPYEQRVAILPFPPRDAESAQFRQLYEIEWKQQLWQYYNIQSLDIIMMPRATEDYVAFESALRPDANTLFRLCRRWQLTNTRYLLGPAGFVEALNQQIDPVQHRFRLVTPFAIAPKPGLGTYTKLEELTAVTNTTGPLALIEFTGALPRAKLYTHWQVSTNDPATLDLLAGATFDPEQTVLVKEPLPAANPPTAAGPPGTVSFVSYAPKRIELKARATAPSVLLLNDKHDTDWQVLVDGRPAPLLHCNFLMRGVQVPAGEHTILFRFAPPVGTFYLSLAGVLLGLGLLGFLVLRPPAPPPD